MVFLCLKIPCCVKLGIRNIDVILFAVYFSSISFGLQLLFLIFENNVPDWSCSGNNETLESVWTKNCSVFKNCNATIQFKSQFYSAVEQMQLLCNRGYLATLISTCQFAGSLIGATVISHVTDAIGRKFVLVGTLICGFFMVNLNGFVPSWQLLAATRFGVGFSVGATFCTVTPFVYEMLQPKHRIFLRCFFNWGWARMLQTVICFIVPHWRYSSFVLSSLCLPAIILTMAFLPESYHWLEAKNKSEKAVKAHAHIEKFNGDKETDYVPQQQPEQVAKKIYTFRDLFTTRKQGLHTFTLIFMRFAASAATYISDLNSGSLAGDLFLNQFLFSLLIGLSKIPLFFLDSYVVNFNRRRLHHIPQVGIITCYLTSVIFTLLKLNPTFIVVANLIGTIFLEYTWDACALCSIEGFPTVVRSIGLGATSFGARIGSLLAPQIIYLKTYWEPAAFATVAGISFCSLTISYLFLPDTKNIELVNTIETQDEDKRKSLNSTRGTQLKEIETPGLN